MSFLAIHYSDLLDAFRKAMSAEGLATDDRIVADGEIKRFHVQGDRPHQKNGWYFLHADNVPWGMFGTWREPDNKHHWCSKSPDSMTIAERVEYESQRKKTEAARKEAQVREQFNARLRAREIWDKCEPCNAHPYLDRKRVDAIGVRVHKSGALVIPAYDVSGILHTLQFINHDGEKRFLSGGAKASHFHQLGELKGVARIAEGLATGATIHMATGECVVLAFDASNLIKVAAALRAKYPTLQIIICGDDDRWTEKNPGRMAAEEAARLVGGVAIFPKFENYEGNPTDFNDLHVREGIEVVRLQLCGSGAVGQLNIAREDEWPDPIPLPDLLPVEAFDEYLLPESLRPWAVDLWDLIQCAPDYIGVSIMTALGVVIGRKVAIRPKAYADWSVVVNQWGLIIGRPGVLKSPAIEATLGPLKRLQEAAEKEYGSAEREYDQKH